MPWIDEKTLSKMVDASLLRRYHSDATSERPLIAEDITDGIFYERRRIHELILAMIPEWEERESRGASIKQALEDVLARIEKVNNA